MILTMHSPDWLHLVSWNEVMCGMLVMFFILALKAYPRIPGALLGLALATFISNHLGWELSKVGELTASFPVINFPQLLGSQWFSLFIVSIPLALLGATESLLSAKVIDRLEHKAKPHHSNLELLGQGVANIVVGLFSGMPVTGVVVRSTVNIQSGGKTRFAAMAHGLILIVALLYFSEMLAQIPIAALAGLLCLIGFRLVETHHFVELLKKNKLEAISFLIATIGTLNNKLFVGLLGAIALVLVGRLISKRLKKSEEFAEDDSEEGLRAVISHQKSSLIASHAPHDWRVRYQTNLEPQKWIIHVEEKPWLHSTSYVHPNATLIGRVIVDRSAHIAAETSIRADEGSPFYVGTRTNLHCMLSKTST